MRSQLLPVGPLQIVTLCPLSGNTHLQVSLRSPRTAATWHLVEMLLAGWVAHCQARGLGKSYQRIGAKRWEWPLGHEVATECSGGFQPADNTPRYTQSRAAVTELATHNVSVAAAREGLLRMQ